MPDNFTKRLRRPSAAFLRRFSDGQNTVLQIACFEHIRVGVAFCGKRAKLVSMILLGEINGGAAGQPGRGHARAWRRGAWRRGLDHAVCASGAFSSHPPSFTCLSDERLTFVNLISAWAADWRASFDASFLEEPVFVD